MFLPGWKLTWVDFNVIHLSGVFFSQLIFNYCHLTYQSCGPKKPKYRRIEKVFFCYKKKGGGKKPKFTPSLQNLIQDCEKWLHFYVQTHAPTNTFVLLVKNTFLFIFSTDTKLHLEKTNILTVHNGMLLNFHLHRFLKHLIYIFYSLYEQ